MLRRTLLLHQLYHQHHQWFTLVDTVLCSVLSVMSAWHQREVNVMSAQCQCYISVIFEGQCHSDTRSTHLCVIGTVLSRDTDTQSVTTTSRRQSNVVSQSMNAKAMVWREEHITRWRDRQHSVLGCLTLGRWTRSKHWSIELQLKLENSISKRRHTGF